MCLFPDDYSFGIFFQVEFEDIIADTDLDFRQSHCHRRAFHLGLHLVKVIFVLVYQHHQRTLPQYTIDANKPYHYTFLLDWE